MITATAPHCSAVFLANDAMDGRVDEKAVEALESLYSGPTSTRQLAQAREIFSFLRSEGQVRLCI